MGLPPGRCSRCFTRLAQRVERLDDGRMAAITEPCGAVLAGRTAAGREGRADEALSRRRVVVLMMFAGIRQRWYSNDADNALFYEAESRTPLA
jgi:hypothetical protein